MNRGVDSSYYGSRAWANAVLRLAIAELKNKNRVLEARQLEIFHYLHELEYYGYWWQVRILRYQINNAIRKDLFTARRADPLSKRGGASK